MTTWAEHQQMVADGHGMHECGSDCPPAPRLRALTSPQVRRHVASGPPETIGEFAAWLNGRIAAEREWLDDEDPAKMRSDLQAEHRSRWAAYKQCRDQLGLLLSWERDDQDRARGEESIEQAYKDAYGPEPLAAWQAEGR